MPKHEPKYEIIQDTEEKVTVVKEASDKKKNPVEKSIVRWTEVTEKPVSGSEVNETLIELQNREKHQQQVIKPKKRRVGLLGSGKQLLQWEFSLQLTFLLPSLLVHTLDSWCMN